MYADTNDLKNVDFSIGADKPGPYSYRGNIPFSDISGHLGILKSDTLYNGANRIGIIDSYGNLNGGVYSMEFLITPDSASYLWRLITTGSGKFDCWTFDLYNGALPSSSEMSDSIFYKLPDTEKTTVSSFQCLDEVISVGNYTNRQTYLDYNGDLFVNTSTVAGEIHPSSSHGPTRDGRIKPEICSPGDLTLAAVPLSLVPGIVSGYPDALAQGGFHVRNGGSSHSSPGVAGIAALYLQMDPGATAAEIRNAIICSAYSDVFTDPLLPNNTWGYGKANAYGALSGCISTSLEDPEENEIMIYPNPASAEGFEVSTEMISAEQTLLICNTLGQKVMEMKVTSPKTRVTGLAPGVYFCNLPGNGRAMLSKKVVIL
jgi:subtilisin family serine protease